jgi:SET domain-containing protein
MVKIDFSEIDGRGVFATQQIRVGTELTKTFVAIKEISKGDELFLNYGTKRVS